MKIAIFGAGAIGGLIGARLARAGEVDLSLIARGPHLAAIKEQGLGLVEDGETSRYQVTATDDPAELGPQDHVILSLKAHSIPGVVGAMQPLLGPDTAVVTAQNGVPWWYFHGLEGRFADHRIEAVDPSGVIWDGVGPERAIGCIAYPAAEIAEPGLIRHIDGDRFTLGEPTGESTDRVRALADALIAAGFKAPVRNNIRNEIWVKLWGNLSFNPISALTGATLATIVADEEVRAIVRTMMVEAQAIAERLGVKFPIDVDRRIAGAGEVGEHRTSMLQDLELGRPMEIDALVGAVQEIGRLTDVPTPTIDLVLALVRLKASEAGCYLRPTPD